MGKQNCITCNKEMEPIRFVRGGKEFIQYRKKYCDSCKPNPCNLRIRKERACKICGGKIEAYVVTVINGIKRLSVGNKRHCDNCSVIAYENSIIIAKKRNKKRRELLKKRLDDKICLECGKPYQPKHILNKYCEYCKPIVTARIHLKHQTLYNKNNKKITQWQSWTRNQTRYGKDTLTILYECPHETKKHHHHFDYRRPFEVILLCQECHAQEHKRLRRIADKSVLSDNAAFPAAKLGTNGESVIVEDGATAELIVSRQAD
jgi:hypothetical protein